MNDTTTSSEPRMPFGAQTEDAVTIGHVSHPPLGGFITLNNVVMTKGDDPVGFYFILWFKRSQMLAEQGREIYLDGVLMLHAVEATEELLGCSGDEAIDRVVCMALGIAYQRLNNPQHGR